MFAPSKRLEKGGACDDSRSRPHRPAGSRKEGRRRPPRARDAWGRRSGQLTSGDGGFATRRPASSGACLDRAAGCCSRFARFEVQGMTTHHCRPSGCSQRGPLYGARLRPANQQRVTQLCGAAATQATQQLASWHAPVHPHRHVYRAAS